ncbi:MAG: hypothetical protein IJT50_07335 [Lentisphaeria bacterium]|nr:hypothetical protein [Lentisphaeria bacterium]
MELDQIMQLLKAKTEVKLLRFVSERGPNCCSACLALDGKVFQADDPDLPELPIHPNCRCKLVEQDSREQVNRPTEVNLLAENQSKSKQFVRNIPEAAQTTLEMKYMPTGTSEMIGGVKVASILATDYGVWAANARTVVSKSPKLTFEEKLDVIGEIANALSKKDIRTIIKIYNKYK